MNLVSPESQVDAGMPTRFPEESELEAKIKDLIATEQKDGNVDDVSVYFNRLNDGLWTAVNENELYAPASILKVPVMMAYLKMAESDPSVLTRSITYLHTSYDTVDNNDFPPPTPIIKGQSYSADYLLRRMIVYSGNKSMDLLYQNIDPDSLAAVFSDLGVPVPDPTNASDTMTVKQAASFFRSLYFFSYLDRASSEQTLELLSQAAFTQGLVQGVPSGTIVAHKFGERGIPEEGTTVVRELHDCGIVYYPGDPYLLCVMTRGLQWDSLEKVLGDISRLVYGWMGQATKES